MTNNIIKNKAPAGNECHYAGLSKRPCRIFHSKYIGTLFGMYQESEHKYGDEANSSKYSSFLVKERGVGIYRQNGYIFLGINLFGLQTLLMVVDEIGVGQDACLSYHYLENEIIGNFDFGIACAEENNIKLDFDVKKAIEDGWKKYQEEYLVGSLIEMKQLEAGDLNETEKKNISKLFEKIMAKGSTGFARMHNPEKVAEDAPNLERVRKILAA